MPGTRSDLWPPSGLSVTTRTDSAGRIVLAPHAAHRIMVHASATTWSLCRSTGGRFLRQRGHIDIVPAGEPGGYDAESASETVELRIPRSLVDRVAGVVRRSGATLSVRHMIRDERISALAWLLGDERPSGPATERIYADSLAVALAERLLGHAGGTATTGRAGAAQRVRDYVEAHLERRLTVAELAYASGVPSGRLRRWFRDATGETLHRYVMRRRVARARELLIAGDMPASEVAFAAGFSHQSHMARWMRRELGQSPSELLRSLPHFQP